MRYLAIVLLTLFSSAALAFTPDDGLWWNPSQSGRGFNIDVQNEILILTVYVYTQSGEPVWYQGVGYLTRTSHGVKASGELTRFHDGQCIGCEYRKPEKQTGFAGPFTLTFHSRTTATLEWAGGTLPIRRTIYAYKNEWDKMLGEWQFVIDFTSHPNVTENYFFSADILRFFHVDSDPGEVKHYIGYRLHSQYARTGEGLGDAAGKYVPSNDAHVIVVDDSNRQPNCLLYYVRAGTTKLTGIAEFFPCDGSPDFEGYPVTGVRTMSKAEVRGAFQTTASQTLSHRQATETRRGAGLSRPFPTAAHGGTVSVEEALGEPVNRRKLRAVVRNLVDELRR